MSIERGFTVFVFNVKSVTANVNADGDSRDLQRVMQVNVRKCMW